MQASRNLFGTNWTSLGVAVIAFLICHPAICQTHQPVSAAKNSTEKLGNFSDFQATLLKTKIFIPQGILNGFSMYQSKENKLNLVSMRSCDGYCCEGLVTVQPMEEADLDGYILFVYAPLQNTLNLKNKESVANGFKARVANLREQVMTNLQQSDRTEFAFDHLNVRGECPRISDAEFKAGHRPQLTIKLWIP